ncbi:TorF family putative porin [Caulobacter sp. NIBR2454]|uniref:TorF family putative porin n=1 Tax=Caulobacter sp. NIBR2454 TaxID=3015996 RepID=UPI0022B655C3|nr:TorF family putative porin [Caulobacter sp. NIBR2454]
MNKRIFYISGLGAFAAIAALAVAKTASAQTPTVSFNAGVARDYVFRGVSQTDENPQVFGGVDATAGQFYAGAWASNVDYSDSTDAEVDLYAGFRPQAAGWSFDVGAVAYLYPGQPDGADYDYVEAKIAASRAVGPATVGGAVFWSPDFFGVEDEATYAEANISYPVAEKITLSGALGRQWVTSSSDYTTWNIGATWAFADHLALDLRYHDTDEHGFGKLYDSRAAASLKATF